uniref:Adenylate kinase n=1 Tax=Trypanosoma vivax (strain Y486) TaxID=1055687 RepID=G0UAP2_TRYVY|nr:conserved hypothetical protein, fragment [Trypanosoma vivax Y486]
MYADTYFGNKLFWQFYKKKSTSNRYKIFACVWDKDSVKDLMKSGAPSDSVGATNANNIDQEGSGDPESLSDGGEGFPKSAPVGKPAPPCSPEGEGEAGEGVCAFWRRDTTVLRRATLVASLIVIEMRYAQDVFDMMHLLTTKVLQKNKRVILVSSLLTWYATPPLQLETPQEENDESEEEEERQQEQYEEQREEEQPLSEGEVEMLLGPLEEEEDNDPTDGVDNTLEMEVFTEDQYNRRIPHAKYFNWREAERVVAAANNDERHLHTCVVFAGMLYGEGEDVLEPFFLKVWSRGERGLPIYGSGSQLVPTVHVRDLVTFTQRLLEAERPPTQRYVFATDNSRVTWKRIVWAMLFTMNMQVDNQTMRDTMPDEEDWVAQSGFVACIDKIAHEFIDSHGLQPIRALILGPPLSGKTCISEALAKRHYQLPTFTVEQAVEDYKSHITTIKGRLRTFRERLFEKEKERRVEANNKAFLAPRDKLVIDEDADAVSVREDEASSVSGNGVKSTPDRKVIGGDDDIDCMNVDFTLTDEELHEVEGLVEEWYQRNERAAQLRETLAAMERVLAMRMRVQQLVANDPLGASNPKKRKELRRRRSGKAPSKKNAEEEEPNSPAQENAPYQDKALAIIVRWRLTRADCRNQGFILDGFPKTVVQARLVFGDSPLEAPDTMEEAANNSPTAGSNARGSGAVEPNVAPVNLLPPTIEQCEEERLPAVVFVLGAPDNYLLDRLTALSKKLRETPGNEEKRLARFERDLSIYQQQFNNTDYSLPNFFECARTVAKALTPGGRAAKVVFIDVSGEPLLSPPPPESAFEVVQPSKLEKLLCRHIGQPHNLGPTPKERYDEVIRVRNLEEEKKKEMLNAIAQQHERERRELEQEEVERTQTESARRAVYLGDRAALEERKTPLRQYLDRNIVPLLSKGLVEVCKARPLDPVDFLAEWLIRHNPHDDSCFDL